MKQLLLICASILIYLNSFAQKPEDTEVYTPVPPVVIPGQDCSAPPSDAIILFDGKDLCQWVLTDHPNQPADWIVNNNIFTVNKKAGNIQTKESFTNYQLHIEWCEPKNIAGKGRSEVTAGCFLLLPELVTMAMSCKYWIHTIIKPIPTDKLEQYINKVFH